MTVKDAAPARSADQFNVRLPPGMREKIAEMARRNGRSMNSEIVERLAESLARLPVEKLILMDRSELAEYERLRREHGEDAANQKFFPDTIARQQVEDFRRWIDSSEKMSKELAEMKRRLEALEKRRS